MSDRSAKLLIPVGAVLMLIAASFAAAHGMPPEDIAKLERGGNLAYVWLGAKHMVTGYDHLLFIFGVVFFLTRIVDVIKFITAFTVGHSITLTIGTYMGVKANVYVIDAIIALTVIYKGMENLDGFKRWLGFGTPNLLYAVFAFGLIHGLGLATRLQQAPLPEDGLLARILSFNAGVELGQITALAIMVLLLAVWRRRRSFTLFSQLANKALIGIGALLFLYQLHGYIHNSQPDDFGFSEDLHNHAHEKMRLEKQRSKHKDSLN